MNQKEQNETHLALQLINLMEENGIRVTVTVGQGKAILCAEDRDNEFHQVIRDDTNLFAAVKDLAKLIGQEKNKD